MNDPNREQLSALSDGELARDALRFLLKRVDGDPALANAWTRYQVIGATLRRDEQMLVDAGFSERVRLQLQDEARVAVVAQGGAARERPWMRWAGGGAIAASVAALALFATRGPQVDETRVAPTAPTLAQEVSVPAAELHAPVATVPAAGGDGAANGSGLWDPRVQGYLMQHGQVAGQIGPSGFVPYVYFMATPSQDPATPGNGNETVSVENAPR